MTTHLTAKREALRLWFEYLRIARSSTNRKVRGALTVHSPFYARWEMDKGEKFDTWWKSHSHLFEEKLIVRKLEAGQTPLDPEALIIEVPLTQSPSVLTKNVRAIIQAAFDDRQKESRKARRKPTASFQLTDGSEPKLDAVREMLSVYRDVYLKNPNLRGEKLLDAAHKYYTVRKNKRWAKVPMALMYDTDGGKIRAMRNLRRYIQKAEKVVLNVASGQFPGIY
jgi:hypothetical protein